MRRWNRQLILAWSVVIIMAIATIVFIIIWNYPSSQRASQENDLNTLLLQNIKNKPDSSDIFTSSFNEKLFNILEEKGYNQNVSTITETKILYQVTNNGQENMGFYFAFNNGSEEIKSIFNFIVDKNGVFTDLKGVL